MQFLLFRLCAVVIAVTLHEYAKAKASWRLGDNLPKLNSRLTMNPLKHLDPLGSLLLVFFGFGWGRPTETSPMFYGNVKKATFVVYTLPGIVNITVGILAAFIAYGAYLISVNSYGFFGAASGIVHGLFYNIAVINAGLALINLLPINPLNGWRVLELFMTTETKTRLKPIHKWMQLFLVLIIIAGVAGLVFNPIIQTIIGFAGEVSVY